VLIVRVAYEALQVDHVELVPHLSTCDPLRQHIALVLQAQSKADGIASQLYAESLANALAVHILRRYAAGTPPGREAPACLSPSKLRRVTAYVQEHLEHELPLVTLAAVAQTSPAHFSRLFKQATGQTPHQYVIMCRIERARQLLAETDLPLSEICHQVGCADQSHFTALFRRHVATTPKAYRDEAQR
jgi:AraC family transcriptional regulator